MPKIIYPSPGMKGELWRRSPIERMLAWHGTKRSRKRIGVFTKERSLQLFSPQQFRPLAGPDIPLIFLSRNDQRLLPSFLSHYRKLGVTRFICVDDQSTDGTAEYLSSQADLDLWTSRLRYKDARRGKSWRQELFQIYGSNHWYLNVDSDEFLIYDRCFEMPLGALIGRIEALSIRRLAAPMIDMYPSGDIAAAEFTGENDLMPWQVADCYDQDGYSVIRNSRFLRIRGGARKRLFGSDVDLMKYPLIFWDDECSLGENIHQPLPYQRNFSPIFGVLLHFKFFSDYQERVQAAIDGGQHFGGAREYVKMMQRITADSEVAFAYPGSVRFKEPRQLVDQGFIVSPFDGTEV
ncbi:glycosyltransferase family 2 protein [Neorhizobium sp. CSC1952]|uniref:Glycosyl transferase family 2 n=2 Tax=Xaviernesmea oryzae TaxID=464029 RepID=A0A1X7GRQ8_9HYPH|nr:MULTISPECIES: glycosyltransferase family 2 protein [Rhizobium/Agrobacterium group]WJR66042.1 glycosyltransferase family 2 protein [Rhizobium sp. CSC1952]SMF73717.1 Glycosyl transferase family 2 [Xaviernesmea oryzae]